MSTRLLLSVALATGLAACASPYRAREVRPAVVLLSQESTVLAQRKLSDEARQRLRLLRLEELYDADPGRVLRELGRRSASDPSVRLLAAEVAILEARKLDGGTDPAVPPLLLQAAEHSVRHLETQPGGDCRVSAACAFAARVHNLAAAGLAARWWETGAGGEPWTVTSGNRSWTIRVVSDADHLDPSRLDRVVAVESIRTGGLINHHRVAGLGAPLAAVRPNPRTRPGHVPQWASPHAVFPATGVLRFGEAEGGGEVAVRLELVDPWRSETVDLGERRVPLAADFSTPLGLMLSEVGAGTKRESLETLAAALRIEGHGIEPEIFFYEPYRDDKIPVVLVHGLLAQPSSYVQMVNDLVGDPELRRRYQVWVFRYPTGLPILLASLRLREEIERARAAYDPARDDETFDRMVVVGHSMGGVVVRGVLIDSGDHVWGTYFDEPLDSLTISEEHRELARRLFFFEPLGPAARAVFVASPLRGSDVAEAGIGRFGTQVIRLPTRLTELLQALHEDDPEKREILSHGARSGDDLRPTSRYMQAVADLPIEVPFHTIIATGGGEGGPGTSDGLVTYESAHRDEAASELWVKVSHMGKEALAHPETIDEVRRLLRLHLEASR